MVPPIVATANQEAGVSTTSQRFIGLFIDAFDQFPKSKRKVLFQVMVAFLRIKQLPYCAVALL